MQLSGGLLLSLLGLFTLATCANSEQEDKLGEQVAKRSADDAEEAEAMGLLDEEDESMMDKRSRLFRYGRGGGIFRYGKRAPVFRYGKRGQVFRYGKRADDEQDFMDQLEEAKRAVFRYGKRGDDDFENAKRLFRWGKRSDDEDEMDMDSVKRVFRYGKRSGDAEDSKRRVFRFGKRGDGYKYGRDTRVPDQPHVPFRFGEEE